jgi:hypothetical protein
LDCVLPSYRRSPLGNAKVNRTVVEKCADARPEGRRTQIEQVCKSVPFGSIYS